MRIFLPLRAVFSLVDAAAAATVQSYITPFRPGPIPGLDTTGCIGTFLFLSSEDLASVAVVSKRCLKFVREAVQLACITLYNRKTPVGRRGEPLTRLLKFIEGLDMVQRFTGWRAGVPCVSAGLYHNLALTSDGKVYGFGDSAAGQVRSLPTHARTHTAWLLCCLTVLCLCATLTGRHRQGQRVHAPSERHGHWPSAGHPSLCRR